MDWFDSTVCEIVKVKCTKTERYVISKRIHTICRWNAPIISINSAFGHFLQWWPDRIFQFRIQTVGSKFSWLPSKFCLLSFDLLLLKRVRSSINGIELNCDSFKAINSRMILAKSRTIQFKSIKMWFFYMRTTGDDSIGFNESRTARFKKIYKLDSIQQDRDDCQCEIISEAFSSLKYDQTI